MPGSIAETVHGRRGGGWLPKHATPTGPTLRDTKADQACKVCHLLYGQHTGRLCPCCATPVEHHTDDQTAACWAGRAHTARAKATAGEHPLNEVEVEALERADLGHLITNRDAA